MEVQIALEKPADVSILESNLTKLRAKRAKLEDRRNRLYTLLEDGTYTPAVFNARMEVLIAEEAELQELIKTLESDISLELSRNKERQLAQLRTVLSQYEDSTLAGRKALLQSIIDKIIYTKEKKTKPADFSISIRLIDFI